ncbi:MAG: phosphoribosylformylglycinamidine cyclo-ligase [Deltaproteobacteria bacterium]|nr:phosphoribosylformylglycinamidine cyclo-ligase [Deltaproteobacteria bacterium]
MGTKTYQEAGVDIAAGNALVEAIKPAAARTRRPEVLGGLGGFGGLFSLPEGLEDPVLVAGTDGVGTKLMVAQATGIHRGLGQDLVAMCVNDIVVCGAEPLFFLDYFATGRLEVEAAREVIEGIADGCEQAGAALLGGETAEMPGFYAPGHFDLAGFAVGVVERAKILDGKSAVAGDRVIGLLSNGLHSNGYSLARKLVEEQGLPWDARPEVLGGETLAEALLEPTRIYVKAALALLAAQPVRSLAHITGGGLIENLPRSLPAGLVARLDATAWRRPPIFDLLLEWGVPPLEAHRTFNMGVGFCAVVPAEAADASLALLAGAGVEAVEIGELVSGDGPAAVELEGLA